MNRLLYRGIERGNSLVRPAAEISFEVLMGDALALGPDRVAPLLKVVGTPNRLPFLAPADKKISGKWQRRLRGIAANMRHVATTFANAV
jgi:hypothetical protein